MSAATQQRRFAEARSDDFVFSLLRERSRAKTCALVPAVPVCISMGMKNATERVNDFDTPGFGI